MPDVDESALIAYVAAHSSAVALAVYDATDPDAAEAALRAAGAEISRIPHPIEPSDGLPNSCYVRVDDGVPVLRLDIKDDYQFAPSIVRIVVDQLTSAAIDGRLEPYRYPEPPFAYDQQAAIYAGLDVLMELDPRGLPPGFPDGFPVPDGTLVLAQRHRDADAEHAVWRRTTGPFTGYLARLRDFGCDFGLFPRSLFSQNANRYTLWRAGAGGHIALWSSTPSSTARRRPPTWYVSVVWQPQAERPSSTVEPSDGPDTRPIGSGPAAIREIAEFVLPVELATGYEAVLALFTVARRLDPMVDAPRDGDPRPKPAVVAERFATVLGRLGPDQLAVIRHVCLTMVANLVANGRRPRSAGVELARDERGLNFAVDVRQRAQGVVEPALLGVFEAGVALVQGAPMAHEVIGSVSLNAVRPQVQQYAWLIAAIDDTQLAAARDACWLLAEP